MEESNENFIHPVPFRDSIMNFIDGQVYEVLFQSAEGKLVEFSDIYLNNQNLKNKRFLIQIIYKDIMLNDKPKKIVFFKDVSFGVLYE